MTQEETELVYEWIVATFGDPSEWTAASVLPKRGDSDGVPQGARQGYL